MNVDDIRKMDELYVCQSCSGVFLFKDDADSHKLETGHTEIEYRSLEELR